MISSIPFGQSWSPLALSKATCSVLLMVVHLFLSGFQLIHKKVIRILVYMSHMMSIYRLSGPNIPALTLLMQDFEGMSKMNDKKRIYTIYLISEPVYFFFKPETVEVIFGGMKNTDKGIFYHLLHDWMGEGLITSNAIKWKPRRKLLTPAFHFKILEDFIPVYQRNARVLTERISTMVKAPWMDVVPLVTDCTLDVICETAMDIQINAQRGYQTEVIQAIRGIGDLFMHRALRPWLYPDMIYRITSSGRQYYKHVKSVNEFTTNVIRKKKLRMLDRSSEDQFESPSGSTSGRKAFLELLLDLHMSDPSFTEEDIKEEVHTFIMAGYETTAMTLSWALYLLGLYPGIQNKVHGELDAIFGSDLDRDVEKEDIAQMKYLECVVKETLRLFPAVPLLSRRASHTFKVAGRTVSKGSICMVLPTVLHRDPESFSNPEKFDPERFFPENSTGRNPFCYVPFSAGPRNCIGQKFAMNEEKVILSNILRKFRVTSLDHRDKLKLVPSLVNRNADPVRMRFEYR